MQSNEKAKVDWPQIGDILQNHAGGRQDPTDELTGHRLELRLEDGSVLELSFHSENVLTWQDSNGGQCEGQSYQAFLVRPSQYFVDYVRADDECRSVSLWIDLARGRAMVIRGDVSDRRSDSENLVARMAKTGSQSTPTISYQSASIGDAPLQPFARTSRLTGKYLRFVYSDTHVYDHFYVSEQFYIWYCWHGPDAGLGDFDEADYFELDDELYLMCWREKFVPCLAVTVEDHRAMRTIGKVYGADSRTWKTANSTVGASMSIITDIPIPPPPKK